MPNLDLQQITSQINLNDEIEYIASINNNIDYLTVSARDATTVLTIKNSLTKLANALNAKNTAISAINQYFNENTTTNNKSIPKVNGPKS